MNEYLEKLIKLFAHIEVQKYLREAREKETSKTDRVNNDESSDLREI